MRNTNRLDVYVKPIDKIRLMRKAHRLGLSTSKLLVKAALDYEVPKQ